MTHADDHPDKLKHDLLKWVEQNRDRSMDWFLDEGPVAVPAVEETVPSAEKPATEPAAEPSVETPAPKPAPPITNPEFQLECDGFVKSVLGLVAQQPARQLVADPLLEKHTDSFFFRDFRRPFYVCFCTV